MNLANFIKAEAIRKFIYQLCKAIHCLHQQNILHRDIKPENLLVNAKGVLKLCDFGFARTIPASGAGLTEYVATRWYRPPELLLSTDNYTPAVDMWAIGCIMGELTDGQPLFPGENEFDQLHLIQKVLGPIIPEHMELFKKSSRFAGKIFSDVSKPETLDQRYLGKMSKKAMQFLKGLLKLNPNERMTSAEALRHPYFEGLHDPNDLGTNPEAVKDITNTKGTAGNETEKFLNEAVGEDGLKSHKEFIQKVSETKVQKSVILNKETNRSLENNFRGDFKPPDVHVTQRSNSLNKNTYKSNLEATTQQKFEAGLLSKKSKKGSDFGTMRIPDTFIKTRYEGSQYNYQIKENLNQNIEREIKNRIRTDHSMKRPTADIIYTDAFDADDNLSRSPPPILKKTSTQAFRNTQLKKRIPQGSKLRDMSNGRTTQPKSPTQAKILDLKKKKHLGSHRGTAEGWISDVEKVRIEPDMDSERHFSHKSQLPQLNLKYSESHKTAQEPRKNHRFDTYAPPKTTGKQNGIFHSYIGSEGMIETDSKRLSGLSTDLNNPFSNGASQNLWVFKPQLPKK